MTLYTTRASLPPSKDKAHHVGQPASAFRNPWPSFPPSHASLRSVLRARFFDKKPPFVPVPADRIELVAVHKPDFSTPIVPTPSFKVIWIGHASFLIQCLFPGSRSGSGSESESEPRQLNILLDPVFSERTSPFTFLGPKRYTPTPCSLSELLDAIPIDVVCISHNHYDHADVTTLKAIYEHSKKLQQNVLFCVALGNPRWLVSLGIPRDQIWEPDWWDRVDVPVPVSPISLGSQTKENGGIVAGTNEARNPPSVRITCTPSQHTSARSIFDKNSDLWCSFVLELVDGDDRDRLTSATTGANTSTTSSSTNPEFSESSQYKALFFAGDTGYRTVFDANLNPDSGNSSAGSSGGSGTNSNDEKTSNSVVKKSISRTKSITSSIGTKSNRTSNHPTNGDEKIANQTEPCPIFAQVSTHFSNICLALLPIGLNRPRTFMSSVHANASDSLDMHFDLKAQRSVGMHWGTVRGGISAYYEDVRDPPREWIAEGRARGLSVRQNRGLKGVEDAICPDANGKDKDKDKDTSVDVDEWQIGLVDVGESLVV